MTSLAGRDSPFSRRPTERSQLSLGDPHVQSAPLVVAHPRRSLVGGHAASDTEVSLLANDKTDSQYTLDDDDDVVVGEEVAEEEDKEFRGRVSCPTSRMRGGA